MGVKGFFKITIGKKTFEQLGSKVQLKDLKDKVIGIDASFIIYNSALAFYLSSSPINGDGASEIKDGAPESTSDTTSDTKTDTLTSHLHIILNKVLQFKKNNIEQLWIFDNPVSHRLKAKELATRDQTREFKLNSKIVEETKKLLNYLGITYITAPKNVEAEHLGAMLTPKVCDLFLSGDSDVLIFGGNLLRPKKEGTKTVYYAYYFEEFLKDADISYDQLVKIAVAMGNDFNTKIKGIGPKTVVSKIKKLDLKEPEIKDQELEEESKSKGKKKAKVKIDQKNFESLFEDETQEEKDEKKEALALFHSRPEFPLDKVNGEYKRDLVINMLKDKNFSVERLEKILPPS